MSEPFYTLRVTGVKRETPDSVSISLQPLSADLAAFTFTAGQYLTLRRVLNGEEQRRNYSLCVSPAEGTLRIGVKKIPGGVFSSWANHDLKPGDTVEAMAPAGSFTRNFVPGARNRYVAFAGGSGITPILSLIKSALETEPLSTFTLFYGNRASAHVMFLEELEGLKNLFMSRFALFHILEEEEEEFALLNGRLDRSKADEMLRVLINPGLVDVFFICGPGPMMDAVEASLHAHGVAGDRILIERFTAKPLSDEQRDAVAGRQIRAAGLKMSVTLNGRKTMIAFTTGRDSILDQVRAAGLAAPYSCKGGVCATCRAKVTAGRAEMKVNYGLSSEEVAQGYILTCQSLPVGEGLAITYDV